MCPSNAPDEHGPACPGCQILALLVENENLKLRLEQANDWADDPYDGIHENAVVDTDRLRAILRGDLVG